MSHIGIHPAPGLGDMVPGWFVIPNNPIRDGQSATGVGYIPHIGELIPAKFGIPENPIIRGLAGCGMGYCGNNNAPNAQLGMGAWYNDLWSSVESSASNLKAQVDTAIPQTADWPWYYWAGVVGVAVVAIQLLTPGGTAYSSARREARAKYKAEVAGLRAKYRGVRRIGRSIGEAAA